MQAKKQGTEKSKTSTTEIMEILEKNYSMAEKMKDNHITPSSLNDAREYYGRAFDACSILMYNQSLTPQQRQRYSDKFGEIYDKMKEIDDKIRHYRSLAPAERREYVERFFENRRRRKTN